MYHYDYNSRADDNDDVHADDDNDDANYDDANDDDDESLIANNECFVADSHFSRQCSCSC